MDHFTTIVSIREVINAIFKALVGRKEVNEAFSSLKSLRRTSKKITRLLNDEFIIKSLNSKRFGKITRTINILLFFLNLTEISYLFYSFSGLE